MTWKSQASRNWRTRFAKVICGNDATVLLQDLEIVKQEMMDDFEKVRKKLNACRIGLASLIRNAEVMCTKGRTA